MKFSTATDIAVPIERVFDEVSDFDAFERMAMRKGAAVVRMDALDAPGIGMVWQIDADFRGRKRRVNAEIVDYDAPNAMRFKAHSPGYDIILTVDLTALSPQRTRLALGLEATPRNLSARLVIQSMRLAKGSLNRRFAKRLGEYGADVEARMSRSGTATA